MPAQPVDATPSNALIRQCFPGRSDLFGCPRSKPSQGSVPADLTLASDLAFVFNASRVRLECCVDPLRPPDLPGTTGTWIPAQERETGWLGNQARLFSPACPTSGPQNTNHHRWFRAAPNMNLTQGALWAFKSQFGNPTMSPYWTFEEDRPSTAARASCWAATYKNWSPMVCASCC